MKENDIRLMLFGVGIFTFIVLIVLIIVYFLLVIR